MLAKRLRAFGDRIWAYIGDFLIDPSPVATAAKLVSFCAARSKVDVLLCKLDLLRNRGKVE